MSNMSNMSNAFWKWFNSWYANTAACLGTDYIASESWTASEKASIHRISSIISDDALACNFHTVSQYRAALLKEINNGA